MKALIVGARGFLGSSLINTPELKGAQVTRVTRGAFPSHGEETWYRIDQVSQHSWDDLVGRGFDVIYHLGWSTVPRSAELDPLADMSENVGSGLRLLDAIKRLSPRSRLIFASSGGAIYGKVGPMPASESHPTEPISAYGIAKLSFEQYLRLYRTEYGIECCSARISNAYGPGPLGHQAFGAVSTFAKVALAGRPLQVFGKTDIVRDFIYVSDVCAALGGLAEVADLPGIVNVGSGTGVSLRELIKVIESCLGRPVQVDIVAARRFDVPSVVLDVSLLKRTLQWEPSVSLASGVQRTIEYIKAS